VRNFWNFCLEDKGSLSKVLIEVILIDKRRGEMKIQVICENCSSIAEFIPKRKEEVGIRTINKQFRIGVNWKGEVIENVQEGFLKAVGKAASDEERKEIIEEGLSENAFTELVDFDLSFTCRGCGDRITLNDFQLIDHIES
jgi:hypothetical protein